MSYKVLDLFCGAGGMSLGFKNAGFQIVGGIDYNEPAIMTHKHNFKNGYHHHGDITLVDEKEVMNKIGNVDVIVGGPPCQGFSSANRNDREEDDPRNKLFFQYLRFISAFKPKFFVIENVPGILSRDKGYAKEKIIEITSKLGYNVNVKVLNADSYGVPQKRTRAFFVGISNRYNTVFDFKNIIPLFANTTVKDAIEDLEKLETGINYNTLKKKRILKPIQRYYLDKTSSIIENHVISLHSDIVVERIKHVPQGGNWKDIPEELWERQRNNRHSSAYRRLDYNKPSITIDTGHMNYFHPVFNRVPTVRESARIQTFQDNFVFLGTRTQQYRQVGNAVPPVLAQVIAIEIKKMLEEFDENN